MALKKSFKKIVLGEGWTRGRITVSTEIKAKISKANRGKNNPNYGKHWSEETKAKMSKSINGLLYWNNGTVIKRSKECPR